MTTYGHKPTSWWRDDKAERSRRVRFKIYRVT
jgi:hypothetical protein